MSCLTGVDGSIYMAGELAPAPDFRFAAQQAMGSQDVASRPGSRRGTGHVRMQDKKLTRNATADLGRVSREASREASRERSEYLDDEEGPSAAVHSLSAVVRGTFIDVREEGTVERPKLRWKTTSCLEKYHRNKTIEEYVEDGTGWRRRGDASSSEEEDDEAQARLASKLGRLELVSTVPESTECSTQDDSPNRRMAGSDSAGTSPTGSPTRGEAGADKLSRSARRRQNQKAARRLAEAQASGAEPWGAAWPFMAQAMMPGAGLPVMANAPMGYVAAPVMPWAVPAVLPTSMAVPAPVGVAVPAPAVLSPQAKAAPAKAAGAAASKAAPEGYTTVMLRNLPNHFTRDMLVAILESEGFSGRFDFVYLPHDFKSGATMGFAFINGLSEDDSTALRAFFHGFRRWPMSCSKVCSVSWAAQDQQGLAANVERYRNSSVMHQSVCDGFKPVVYKDGVRTPFPANTRRLWPPAADHGSRAKKP